MKAFKPYRKEEYLVDGEWIWVGEEIATLLNQDDWKNNYYYYKIYSPVIRCDLSGKPMEFDPLASSRENSLEKMCESGVEHIVGYTDGIEDGCIDRVFMNERLHILAGIIPSLSAEEQRMLEAVADGMSEREYEKLYGVARKTYSYRKDKMLARLRKMIESEEKKRADVKNRKYKELEK